MSASPPFDHDGTLARCARGEVEALHALYAHEASRLLGVAVRIVRDRATAEDVLHDAFVKIWTRAASFDATRGEGRGWVHAIVRHAALDRVREDTRVVPLAEDAAEQASDAQAALDWRSAWPALELGPDGRRLAGCLEGLPAERRDCILLAYVDGCSHGEIAGRTGIALGTVKAWIRRGMAALRECMA